MKAEEIIRILIEEKGYDKVQTQRLEPKIDALPQEIREALEKWMTTGVPESPAYGGYNVERILKMKPDMTVVGAYLALDWIRKDPQTAVRALATPVIRFVPGGKKKE